MISRLFPESIDAIIALNVDFRLRKVMNLRIESATSALKSLGEREKTENADFGKKLKFIIIQKKKVTYSGSENRLCSLKTKIITRTCSMLRIYYP